MKENIDDNPLIPQNNTIENNNNIISESEDITIDPNGLDNFEDEENKRNCF